MQRRLTRPIAVLTAVTVVAIAGALISFGGKANAASTLLPVGATCTGGGQVCNNPANVTVNTFGLLQFQFTASATHCSSITANISVDGVLKQTTAALAAGQAAPLVDVSPVGAGTHTISIIATGITGGCNAGSLASWLGSLTVNTSDAPAVITYQPTVVAQPRGLGGAVAGVVAAAATGSRRNYAVVANQIAAQVAAQIAAQAAVPILPPNTGDGGLLPQR